MQTKTQSATEAATNTASAFILSLLAHKFIVSNAMAEYAAAGNDITDWATAVSVTLFYTGLSLMRNYIIRRFFNHKQTRKK